MSPTCQTAADQELVDQDLGIEIQLIAPTHNADGAYTESCTVAVCTSCIYSTECWTCHGCTD